MDWRGEDILWARECGIGRGGAVVVGWMGGMAEMERGVVM